MLSIEKLDRLARLTYYRINQCATVEEVDEWANLLIEWKLDFDKTAIGSKGDI